jgi:glycosyltransferase involved in cell wall biosynthesis
LGRAWSFLGVLPPVEFAAFLHECELTVLPSINSTESYGLVQVESMTCGTPVVATDLPGVRVPVKMSGMGRIVPPANAPALAEAILGILDDPQAYVGSAENIVRLSSPENVATEYEAAFEAALSLAKKSRERSLEQKET